jgi:hypothetical protein
MNNTLIIDVLGYQAFEKLYREESAHNMDECLYSYERWSNLRTALIGHLRRIGVPDLTGYGSGKFVKNGDNIEYDGNDFFIGEDWFKLGILSVLVLHWKWLTVLLLRECKCFAEQNPDFVLQIEIASFNTEDMFEIIITHRHCYMAFFEKSQNDAWKLLQHQKYNEIRSLMRK